MPYDADAHGTNNSACHAVHREHYHLPGYNMQSAQGE